jgi:gluconolactonase
MAVVLLVLVASCGDDGDDAPGAESATTSTSPTASDPLAERGEVELIADGYSFTEGPQWMPDGTLLFTDSDTIHRLGPGDQITSFRAPSNQANGLAVDPGGRLLAAESRTRAVTRTEPDGTITTMADGFEDSRLNQPNDIAVRSDGTIYFTDPFYGSPTARLDLDFHGVFRIAPNGSLTAEWRGDTNDQPNGVVLSPDESRLYVANWAYDDVLRFDVAADGSLSEVDTFVSTGRGPDGMAVDTAGNLFVTTREGIEVFAPDGSRWGVIEVPNTPANCAFGDADARTLYITAESALYRVRLAQPGLY